jgi:hypothetical protein
MVEQTLLADEDFSTFSTRYLRGHIGTGFCRTNLVVVKASGNLVYAWELTVHGDVVLAQPVGRREVHLGATTHTGS